MLKSIHLKRITCTAYAYTPPMPQGWASLKSDEVIERDWVTDSRPKVNRGFENHSNFLTFWLVLLIVWSINLDVFG